MNPQSPSLESEQAILDRFTAYVESRCIEAEIIDCGRSTLTVADAAVAVESDPDHILKTLLFHDGHGRFVIAIAAGLSKIDRAKLLEASGLQSAKLASPAIVLERLGYPAGGVPPIDLPVAIPVFIDRRAAELTICYAGGGTTRHLVRLDARDIVKLNDATIADIVETS